MRLAIEDRTTRIAAPLPPRRESAARQMLASGELGAHLLRLAEGAAREHVAQVAQEEPALSSSIQPRGGEP